MKIKTCFSQILTKFCTKLLSTGDREPFIVNISHESKTEGNSEAAIWQRVCLIG